MGNIEKHLEKTTEQSRKNQLSKILQRGTITLEEFRMTAKFIAAEDYLHSNPNTILEKDCKEVIEYAGGSIIQLLHTGVFVFKETKSKNLDEVEDTMWYEVCEKLWCENC
jgi:hypothetical protein